MGFKSLHVNHTMNILYQTHVAHTHTYIGLFSLTSPLFFPLPKPFLAGALKAANQINMRHIKMLNSAAQRENLLANAEFKANQMRGS